MNHWMTSPYWLLLTMSIDHSSCGQNMWTEHVIGKTLLQLVFTSFVKCWDNVVIHIFTLSSCANDNAITRWIEHLDKTITRAITRRWIVRLRRPCTKSGTSHKVPWNVQKHLQNWLSGLRKRQRSWRSSPIASMRSACRMRRKWRRSDSGWSSRTRRRRRSEDWRSLKPWQPKLMMPWQPSCWNSMGKWKFSLVTLSIGGILHDLQWHRCVHRLRRQKHHLRVVTSLTRKGCYVWRTGRWITQVQVMDQ